MLVVLGAFLKIVQTDLVKRVVELCNEHHDLRARLQPSWLPSQFKGGRVITVAMFYRWWGIRLLMTRRPHMECHDFWRMPAELDWVCDLIQSAMSLNQFYRIQRTAFFGDTMPAYANPNERLDPGCMDWFIDKVMANGREYYVHTDHVSIDDHALKWYGRLHGKVLKDMNKAHRQYIVLIVVADSNSFALAVTRSARLNDQAPLTASLSAMREGSEYHRELSQLIKRINPRCTNLLRWVQMACPDPANVTLVFDAAFTRLVLVDELRRHGYMSCGTVNCSWLGWAGPSMKLKKNDTAKMEPSK
jgi:hypothetical protein